MNPDQTKNIQSTNRYQELDALRGIAAIMVVLFHFSRGVEISKFGFKLGTTGVDLFFIISGFVIFMSINKVRNSKEFVINRISRLYPTYWTCVTFTFVILSLYAFYKHTKILFVEYLANMTMFQFYLGQEDLDGTYWTMIIEMLFYIVILLFFHFKKMKYVNHVFLTVSILIALLLSLTDNSFTQELVEMIPLLQFLPMFLAGITFFNMHNQKQPVQMNYCILLICYACQVAMFYKVGRSQAFISQIEYAGMIMIYFILFILFVHGKLKWIVSKPTLFFGKISFALYLIHECITARFIMPLCVNRFHINIWIIIFFILLPVAVGLATLITYYVDVPLSYKMRQKLRSIFG